MKAVAMTHFFINMLPVSDIVIYYQLDIVDNKCILREKYYLPSATYQ